MEYVVYRETKPGIPRPLLEMVVQRAVYTLQLRLATEKANKKPSDYLASISGLISGFDDDAHSAVVGFIFESTDLDNFNQFSAWAFNHLFEALLPGTWDLVYKGETTLDGFKLDFSVRSREKVEPPTPEDLVPQPSIAEAEPVELTKKPKRPASVNMISWILIIFGSITLIFAVIMKISPPSSVTNEPEPAIPFFLIIIILSFNIISGSFMLHAKTWARILFIINAVGLMVTGILFYGMQVLFSIVLLSFFIYMLTRPEENDYFGQKLF